MDILCTSCGHSNRDSARVCGACGYPLAPRSEPQLPSVVPHPTPLSTQGSRQFLFPNLFQTRPVVRGEVDVYNERQEVHPTNFGRWLFRSALIIGLLPIFSVILMVVFDFILWPLTFVLGGYLGLVVSIAGLGLGLSLGAVIVGTVSPGIKAIADWLAKSCFAISNAMLRIFTIFNVFSRKSPSQDKALPTALVLTVAGDQIIAYGDHVAKSVNQGDVVEVYGHRGRDGVVRAKKLLIVGTALATTPMVRRRVPLIWSPSPGVIVSAWALAILAIVLPRPAFPDPLPLISSLETELTSTSAPVLQVTALPSPALTTTAVATPTSALPVVGGRARIFGLGTSKSLNVRAKPGVDEQRIGSLEPETMVSILAEQSVDGELWQLVQAEKIEGWVKAQYLEPIP